MIGLDRYNEDKLIIVAFIACDDSSTEPNGEKLTEMAGTNWYVKNVHFRDGSVKSINEKSEVVKVAVE